MKKQIVTSIKVDQEIWKKAKIEAIKRGLTVADFVNIAIEGEIRGSK